MSTSHCHAISIIIAIATTKLSQMEMMEAPVEGIVGKSVFASGNLFFEAEFS